MRDYVKPDLELKLYIARIYDTGKNGDDRLQVRIVPDMIDYEGESLDNLPKYPSLFKGTFVNGFTEKNPNPETNQADEVMVIASYDFTVGYILGLTNRCYSSGTAPFQDSYGFSYVQDYLGARGLNSIEYENMVVDMWCSTDKGGIIILHDYKTGDLFVINSSGTCAVLQQDKIYLRVGSPNGANGSTGAKSNPFSSVTIDSGSVSIKTKVFDVDAENVLLGHHGLNVLGTISTVPIACDGVNLQAVKTIQI